MAVPSQTTSIQVDAQPDSAAATSVPTRPKIARAPLWARLPPLLSATDSSLASPAHPNSITPPPIVLPDRVGTTRVLLQDVQATIQKFAARMDTVGADIEQALKEVQFSRSSIDAAGEKTVAELADIIRHSQASTSKILETQKNAIDKLSDKMGHLICANDSITRLYETHTSSLNSILQAIQSQANLIQILQEQQCRILTTISPLEPLIRAIPVHLDANRGHCTDNLSVLDTIVEKAVSRGIEHLLAKTFVTGAEPHLPCVMPEGHSHIIGQLSRGQKRKSGERDDQSSDSITTPSRRPPPLTAASLSGASKTRMQNNVDSPSALAIRRRSTLREAALMQRRASIRRFPTNNLPAGEARKENTTTTPIEVPDQATLSRIHSSSLVSRRSTRPLPESTHTPCHVNLSTKSSRTRSQAHIGGSAAFPAIRPSVLQTRENANIVRNTRSSTTARKDLGFLDVFAQSNQERGPIGPETSPQAADKLGHVDNAPQIEQLPLIDVPIECPAGKAPEVAFTEDAAGTVSTSENKNTKAKNAKKRTKVNGSSCKSKKRGKGRKGKTVPATEPTELGSLGGFCEENRADDMGESNVKRQKTAASDRTLTTVTSAASEHGPPNSPLRPPLIEIPPSRLSGQPSDTNRVAANRLKSYTSRASPQVKIMEPAKGPSIVQPPLRRLIDLSYSSVCTEEDEAIDSLATALAHVSTDIDYLHAATSSPKTSATEPCDQHPQDVFNINLMMKPPMSDSVFITSSGGVHPGIISRPQSGRSRRYLVEDDSAAFNLIFDDDLLDE